MKEKRVKGGVLFDGVSSEVWKKTSHQALWQIFERTFTQRFTSGTFTRISCATLKMIRVIEYDTNHGSPWINVLSEAEKWLSEQETKRLDSDNIKRASTKWEFVSFFNVDVKVVLDHQPLLGTGPLPDWLRNFARGRAGPMVALGTYQDNLCLWRCIAVHRGARPDRSTTAARELANGLFKLRAAPNDSPKTSLDELDRVERHLNQGAAFSDWLGIRVYEPVRVEGEVVWHLRRNPPAKPTNILTSACEVGEIDVELPRPQTQSYPYAILYDFEAYSDKNQRKEPTDMLTIENAHVPISVSVGDTLDREPTHICEKKPSGTGPHVHGRAGAAQEKHPDQSTSGMRARRCEDASKSAAHQN